MSARARPRPVDPATALAALGHGARLDVFRLLVRTGREGLPVHAIQEALGGMPRSTLAHHLQMLVQAGLVRREKVGAEVRHAADFGAMDWLVAYLTDECCVDARGADAGAEAPPAAEEATPIPNE